MADAEKKDGIDTSTLGGAMLGALVDYGLLPDQAEAILKRYKQTYMAFTLLKWWDTKCTDLPPMTENLAWRGVQATTGKWIEENCPEHRAKPIFITEQQETPAQPKKPPKFNP